MLPSLLLSIYMQALQQLSGLFFLQEQYEGSLSVTCIIDCIDHITGPGGA
jgi:hypothetical protein